MLACLKTLLFSRIMVFDVNLKKDFDKNVNMIIKVIVGLGILQIFLLTILLNYG